jgi:4'-phosphopantetheinyl transferase
MSARLELRQDTVALWPLCFASAVLPASYPGLLHSRELQRIAAHRQERHRFRQAVTRVFLRLVLSRYACVPPAKWEFGANPQGRPFATNAEALSLQLHFNLSHTDQWLVVAVARERCVGVDLENLRRPAPLALAERYFHPREAQALRQLPRARQALHFWRLWTLKESYLKASGTGLSGGLHSAVFGDLRGDSITMEPESAAQDGRSWEFAQHAVASRHVLALCTQRHPQGPAALAWQAHDLLAGPGPHAMV